MIKERLLTAAFGLAIGALLLWVFAPSPEVIEKPVLLENPHQGRADSLKVIVDSLQLELVKDSLIINAYETHHEERIDSVRVMSSSELYRIWSGGRHLRLDSAESVH